MELSAFSALSAFKMTFKHPRGAKSCNVRVLFTFLFFTVLLNPVCSQPLNYREVFGEDWKNAISFEKENRIWMKPALERYHISYPVAIAVIFPELVRYSALRDKMEITLLKALYINLGSDYANFSIGRFQMKPSFAETILEEVPVEIVGKSGLKLKVKSDFGDIINFRRSVVNDLENTRSQFNYLIAFLKVCEKKFSFGQNDEIMRLRFLATAYNYGIDRSSSDIENMIDKRFFNTKLFKTDNYSYADVALFWYKENIKEY